MATIEEFESALKDVVKAKRLSQSKMSLLSGIAMQNMKNDTQMVSILYRTHKSLSSSEKVSSLYAFDALARAARSQVNKHNLVANVNSETGNCATFLLKIEGVLDGLFHDMVSSRNDELKEKAKKILDIWTKSNTFPSAVLSPLSGLLKETEKVKEPSKVLDQSENATRRAPAAPPNQAPITQLQAPPTDVDAVQSTLVALLSQAASAVNGGQTAPNNVPVAALDANQLALLQQLAQTAKGNAVPSHPIVPVSGSVVPSLTAQNAVPVVPPVRGPSQPLPYRDDHNGPVDTHAPHRESDSEQQKQRYGGDRFAGPPLHGYSRDDNHDNADSGYPHQWNHDTHTRSHHRDGAFNHRGGYRSRGDPGGRGHGRGRWDQPHRDHRNRDYDDHRNKDYDDRPNAFDCGRRSSRSLSPPVRNRAGPDGGMGMIGPGGDARRAPFHHDGRQRQELDTVQRYVYVPGPGADPEMGFDEFGRELRPSSPGSESDLVSARTRQPLAGSPPPIPPPPRSASVTTSDRESVTPENQNPSALKPYSQHHPEYSQPYDCPSDHADPPTSSNLPSTSGVSFVHESEQRGVGLNAFDRTAFDPAQPASWDALGKAWAVTHGSMPTQEELVQFAFGDMSVPQAVPASTSTSREQVQDNHQYDPPAPQLQQYGRAWRGHGQERQNWVSGQRGGWRGRGASGGGGDFGGRGFRGDHGHGGHGQDYEHDDGSGYGREDFSSSSYGNVRGAYNAGGRDYGDFQETDAVILSDGGYPHSPVEVPSGNEEGLNQGGGGGAGKMQKVGDKWLFIRGA